MSAECSLHNAAQYFAYFVFNKNNLMTITSRDKQRKDYLQKNSISRVKRDSFSQILLKRRGKGNPI